MGTCNCASSPNPNRAPATTPALAVAKAAEDLGFDAFFRSDHYLKMGEVSGLPGPTDASLTLAGLARETSRIRLGTLVSPVTFRLPGALAIQVAQVDEMTGGRVELGLGLRLVRPEHTAYGIPFPPTARFDRLEEQLAIVTGLWETPVGQRFSFAGKFYPITDSPALPKPVQRPHPPMIIGGRGAAHSALAARYADEFNVAFVEHGAPRPSMRAGARGVAGDRPDADSLVYSSAAPICSAVTRRSWPAARRRSAGLASQRGRASRAPRRRWSTGSGRTPHSARPGSTCRSWTCTTSTTWS